MAWENLKSPGRLNREPHGSNEYWAETVVSQFRQHFRIDWDADVSFETLHSINERVFSVVCLETFELFRGDYSRDRKATGRVEWRDCQIRAADTPFFLLQVFDSDNVRLHWFKREPIG
jgi:hypothetical protein